MFIISRSFCSLSSNGQSCYFIYYLNIAKLNFRFYRCVKFNQYSSDFTVFEYDCPAGLAFDEKYEVCVWPGSLRDASPCKGNVSKRTNY